LGEEKYRVAIDSDEKSASLTVLTRILELEDTGPFEIRCRELLESQQPRITVDLCQVERVPSTVIGAIVNTHDRAVSQGRSFTVSCRKVIARILNRLLGGSVQVMN
jgi:anti-anti-sigma regulatory factor